MSLETRTQEILAVSLQTTQADAALDACMEQLTWNVELPVHFDGAEHWTITL